MKKTILTLFTAMSIIASANNPLESNFDSTIHNTVPFSKIDNSMWEPAIDRGIEIANSEIKAIVENPEEPTFDNTIKALEATGADLNRVLLLSEWLTVQILSLLPEWCSSLSTSTVHTA